MTSTAPKGDGALTSFHSGVGFRQEISSVEESSQEAVSGFEVDALSSNDFTHNNFFWFSSDYEQLNTNLVPSSYISFEDVTYDFLPQNMSEGPDSHIVWKPPAVSGLVTTSPRKHTTEVVLRSVQNSTPVSRHASRFITRVLRSYPQMMLRRNTLPPFIHPLCSQQSDAINPTFPEPLAICISIAHIFAARSKDSSNFLWRTIITELQRIASWVSSPWPSTSLGY